MSSDSVIHSQAVAVARRFGEPSQVGEIPGGASLRRFYRIGYKSGASAIAMYFPDAQTTGAGRLAEPRKRWPFLEIQENLAAIQIAVPEILVEDCDRGWLLVEDLGANCLADLVEQRPDRSEEAYRLAVRQLAYAQRELASLPQSSVIRKRSFDFDFLFSELEHFLEYGLLERGFSVSHTQAERFRELSQRLCTRITEFPYGFSHRDFQSRNLMVREPLELVWIDFQDAAEGPRAYDLVALLRDSYQSFDEEFVAARLADYAQAAGISGADDQALRAEFDALTVQRKLKDAGRFVYIDKYKRDPSYLKYVAPTLALVMNTLSSAPEDTLFSEFLVLLTELGISV